MSPEDIATLVAESRAKCGLGPKVTDPSSLRRLATLFGPGRDEGALADPSTDSFPHLTAATPPQRGGGLRAG